MSSDSFSSGSPLQPQEIHVWHFSLQGDPLQLEQDTRILSTDERQRADRFAFPDLRRRFVATRVFLRKLLGRYAGVAPEAIQFTYGPEGKPELRTGNWHFNLAHSGEQALIAISIGGAVGVDLEIIRPLDFDAVARGVLPEEDLRTLSDTTEAGKAEVFFCLWVRHEARVKAAGSNIASRPDIPVYDLLIEPTCRAAVATCIQHPRIQLFSA